jgi:hypothetical protein
LQELVNTTFCEKYRQMSYESISKRSIPRHQIVSWLSKLDSDTYFHILGSAQTFFTGMITSLNGYLRSNWAMIDQTNLLVWSLSSIVEWTLAIWDEEQTNILSLMYTIFLEWVLFGYFFLMLTGTEEEKPQILTWKFYTTDKWESGSSRLYWPMLLALVDLAMLSLDAFDLERKSLARKLPRIFMSTLQLAIACIEVRSLVDTEEGHFNGLLIERWFVLITILIMPLLLDCWPILIVMRYFCDIVPGALRLRIREASSRFLTLVLLFALVFVSLNQAFM